MYLSRAFQLLPLDKQKAPAIYEAIHKHALATSPLANHAPNAAL